MSAITLSQSVNQDLLANEYELAVKRYIEKRRSKVDGFVEDNFSFRGSLALHRHSIGWDVLKTPANMAGSLLTVGKGIGAYGSRKLGAHRIADKVNEKNFFLETEIGKVLDWKIRTELLELPYIQGEREYKVDALMLELFNTPVLQTILLDTFKAIEQQRENPAFADQLTRNLEEYLGTRAAASDLAVSLTAASIGALALNKITPGILSLSGSIASSLAHTAAINSFWAGPTAGGIVYSFLSVSTPPLLAAGVFTAMIVPLSAVATFSGVVTDPLQTKLGLHQRRLNKLIDSVELAMLGDADNKLSLKDHYVARTVDFIDWASLVIKSASHS